MLALPWFFQLVSLISHLIIVETGTGTGAAEAAPEPVPVAGA